MFYHLEGKVTDLSPDSCVIDCSGTGYEVFITPNTASALKTGDISKLYISESIGEDHFDLYGFLSEKEKKFYKLLIGVSGIGPKAAMSILSYNSPDSLAVAIINGNEKALTSCPGVGKKIAQRVILELKDKISKQAQTSDIVGIPVMDMASPAGTAYDEALTALSVLGYSTSETVPILKQVYKDGMKTDDLIRQVLKYMI